MKLSHFYHQSILLVIASGALVFIRQFPSQAFEIPCIPVLCNPPTEFNGSNPPPPPPPPPTEKPPDFPYIAIKNQTRKAIVVKALIHLNGRNQLRPGNDKIWVFNRDEEFVILDGIKSNNRITDAGFGLIILDREGRRIFNPNSGLFSSIKNPVVSADSYFVEIMKQANDHSYIKESRKQDGGFLFTIIEPPPLPPQPWIFPIPNWQ